MRLIDISLLSITFVLFGILATRRLTLWRSLRDIACSAIVDYKASFAAEISHIRNRTVGYGTFIDAFPKHKAAVDNIMPILPERHQRKLQSAWDEYCGKGTHIECEVFISGGSTHPEIYPKFKNNRSAKVIWVHRTIGGRASRRTSYSAPPLATGFPRVVTRLQVRY